VIEHVIMLPQSKVEDVLDCKGVGGHQSPSMSQHHAALQCREKKGTQSRSQQSRSRSRLVGDTMVRELMHVVRSALGT
jgi:hypothetical protein